MRKKVFLLLVAMLALMQSVFAQQFSAVAPSGQTLYYNIVNGNAQVTRQYSSSPYYTTYPTGDLTIPSNVTYNSITYVVTSIDQYAFLNCGGINSVTIPNSITYIGNNAFKNCSGLTTISIPNSITNIGDGAFYGCSNLTSIDIPNSVTRIRDNVFYGCTSLTSVIIPNSVTSISDRAFQNCTGLPLITIPNSVTNIGNFAFARCISLTSVTIPNSVTSIERGAFYDCTRLPSITIPNSVTDIDQDAFYRVRHIEYYGTAAGRPWGAISMNGVTEGDFVYSDTTKQHLLAYIGRGGDVAIPSTVITIEHSAFYACNVLTSISIPNSVTNIGESAFSGCTSLASVTIPGSVTSIGPEAFGSCIGLFSVNYTGTIAQWCNLEFSDIFSNPTGYAHLFCINGIPVTNLVIPEDVTDIKKNTFIYGRFASITIPNSVISICEGAFDCFFYPPVGPTSVTLGDKNLTVFSNDTLKGRAYIQLPYVSTTNLWNNTVYVGAATTSVGNQFVAWSDGITEFSRTITLTENRTLTAIFTLGQYTLDVSSNNSNYGSVSGSGTYYYGDTATVIAYPIEHYHFIRWSDNSTENPRRVIITGDTYLTAYFDIDTYTVNVQSNDLTRGYVTKSGTEFTYGSSCTVTATAFSGYTFACWSDGATENQYTFTVEQDMDLTAVFVAEGEQLYTVMLQSANPFMGTVSGGGRAIAGSDVVIKAKGKQGYRFVRWNDNNTDSIRTVHVSCDITYTAYFESTSFGIDDVEGTEAKPIIFARDGNIIVRDAQRMDVRVYDMMGRRIAYSNAAEEHDIPMPTAGVYLVKVGTLPAHKVAVIR